MNSSNLEMESSIGIWYRAKNLERISARIHKEPLVLLFCVCCLFHLFLCRCLPTKRTATGRKKEIKKAGRKEGRKRKWGREKARERKEDRKKERRKWKVEIQIRQSCEAAVHICQKRQMETGLQWRLHDEEGDLSAESRERPATVFPLLSFFLSFLCFLLLDFDCFQEPPQVRESPGSKNHLKYPSRSFSCRGC